MTLCHSVLPESSKSGEINYKASNSEEIALLKAAAKMGFTISNIDQDLMKIYNSNRQESTIFEIKHLIPFESERRRMSVIVFNSSTKEFFLLTKGSDEMTKHMLFTQNELISIEKVVKDFLKNGL
jgi:magnesium-transporting ATPase (P-type)